LISGDDLVKRFEEYFKCTPQWIASAPGRVNLIGEHTDYNGGFVLPVAINRGIVMAVRIRRDESLNLYSESFNEFVSFSLSSCLHPPNSKGWYSYFLAVVNQFHQAGVVVPGMDVFLSGDVPLQAGLSSSAAYEVCTAVLINAICEVRFSKRELALLSQRAEQSEFIGVKCGIMDQFISCMALKNHALLIDCYSLEVEHVPFYSSKAVIVIINTMKKRGLIDSEYNKRREECEQGLKIIQKLSGKAFPTIRHISLTEFERYKENLSGNVRKRLLHNLIENDLVLEFVEHLKKDNFKKAGELMTKSHESLQLNYEVSCKELDWIVGMAVQFEGVYGCRMTGAGFGGCAVALVRPDILGQFMEIISRRFFKEFVVKPEIYKTKPTEGANIRLLN
jgi:galactokinase